MRKDLQRKSEPSGFEDRWGRLSWIVVQVTHCKGCLVKMAEWVLEYKFMSWVLMQAVFSQRRR